MDRTVLNAWKPRVLLVIGVVLMVSDILGRGRLGLAIPWWIAIYLIISSIYFAANPQKMAIKRSEEVLSYLFFPGAFVTALVPVYAILLFLAKYSEL